MRDECLGLAEEVCMRPSYQSSWVPLELREVAQQRMGLGSASQGSTNPPQLFTILHQIQQKCSETDTGVTAKEKEEGTKEISDKREGNVDTYHPIQSILCGRAGRKVMYGLLVHYFSTYLQSLLMWFGVIVQNFGSEGRLPGLISPNH